jgi:penicillin-binding protein 2
MVSGPNFSPESLTGGAFKKNYGKMVLDVGGPLLNRAIKGEYPPGSTFKPIGGLVALDEGLITPSYGYGCSGRYYACGIGKPACTHAGGGHAANLRLAIANSCNSYFTHIYRMAVDNPKLGGKDKGYSKWKEYLNNFGLGVRLGVDLPSENDGNVPDTSVYNRVYRNSWNSCTNLTLGIGQDMMLATPLQLANAMCLIANKGYYYTPHFVKDIDSETEQDTILNKFRIKHEVLTHIPDTAYETIIRGMQDVVEIGTAKVAKIPGINVCAKTGTAEVYRNLDGKRTKLKDNSMFVCFAPRENPKIAIAVVVENAGFGGTWAGPIAALMMEKYLNDTLRTERLKEVERIAASNLMPGWLAREQYKADSSRAQFYFKLTKDSSYLKKFFKKSIPQEKKDTTPPKPKEKPLVVYKPGVEATEPKNSITLKKRTP